MVVRIARVVGRVLLVGVETVSPIRSIMPNNAVSNPIAIAISNPTATATVYATTIVAPLQSIITLPTTITTTL